VKYFVKLKKIHGFFKSVRKTVVVMQ